MQLPWKGGRGRYLLEQDHIVRKRAGIDWGCLENWSEPELAGSGKREVRIFQPSQLFPEGSRQHRIILLTASLLCPAHFVDDDCRMVLVNSRHHWVLKFLVNNSHEPDF